MKKDNLVEQLKYLTNELEYSAYNLCNGQKYTDLPKGIIESTGAETTLLIVIRDLILLTNELEQTGVIK